MNDAAARTAALVEETLAEQPGYRKLGEDLYVVREGSAYVAVHVASLEEGRAILRCVARLVEGLRLSQELAGRLLRANAHVPFGAFAYEPEGQVVLFLHSILGGSTLDPEEIRVTVRDVARIADKYDDGLARFYGGARAGDRMDEEAIRASLRLAPSGALFGPRS